MTAAATRTRTRGTLLPLTTTWNWWDTKTTIPAPSTATRQNVSGSFESMTDTVQPEFRKRQAKGEIFTAPMLRTLTSYVTGDAGWKIQNIGSDRTYYGEFTANVVTVGHAPPTHLPLASTLALELECDTQARASVVAPDVQLGVTIAEAMKTLRMIRRPFKSIIDIIRKRELTYRYVKGSKKTREVGKIIRPGASEARSAAEASWLEARYGWRPFLLEIESILETLKKENPIRMTARAKRKSYEEAQSSGTYVVSGGILSIPYDVVTTRSVTVRSGILYEHMLDGFDQFGLTWRDLPGTAWELVPFSFVVDWFLNVGSFIEALTPRPGVRHLAMWRTVSESTVTVRTTRPAVIGSGFPGWSVVRSPGAVESLTTNRVSRIPSLYPPALTFKSGSLNAVLQDARAMDLFAILNQLLTGKKLSQHRI